MFKRFVAKILPRRLLPLLMLLVQLFLLGHLVITGNRISQIANLSLAVVSFGMCIYIASTERKGAFKVSWILLILVVPLFGITAYILFNGQTASRQFDSAVRRSCREVEAAYRLPPKAEMTEEPLQAGQQRYLENCGFPVYGNTDTQFLPVGERAFEAMLAAMEQAKDYIFLEFFIIEEGKMWQSVLELLKRKAAQGVKVRLIYDDLGCFFLLPADYPRQLGKWGIECAPFNPFRPLLTAKQNNRDHRKILSVDGKVAFTGGINLADEYINAVDKFGHWKDTAVRLEGYGAWGLTVMFLQSWRLCTGTGEDPAEFYPWPHTPCPVEGKGLAQPYGDSPVDTENVGERVYLGIIGSAREYLYITTPYLIVDESMVSALTMAAKSGVDVRIVTPYRWDKRLVHVATRSYYSQLLRGGVKIYEYSPGFIHSKTFLCDGRVATVGTVNMDYRSLYLHFECGVCLYDARAVEELKQDTETMLESCRQITLENYRVRLPMRLLQGVVRLFAPLM